MQLSKFVAKLVISALAAIDTFFISKITNVTVQAAMRLTLEPLKKSALALSDNNPKNDEQIEAIWKQYAGHEAADFTQERVTAAIEKVSNPDVKAVLLTLTLPTVDLLRIVSDDNVHDGEQIKEMVNTFLKADATQKVALQHIVIPFLTDKIKDEGLRSLILTILQEILDGGEIVG